jgi:RNA-directed DNA polymerase
MGFFDWVKRLFGSEVKRDTSRLDGDDRDADRIEEVVDLSGGPLKPEHRRRALRDRRLLPKTKGQRFVTKGFSTKRRKFMSKAEADRLFAGTLRTTNRKIRDLLPDEEQLARYGLPVWKTEADVAAALGISVGLLQHYAIHRSMDRVSHYVSFTIKKRDGSDRIIRAPKKKLKKIQRQLLALLVDRLPVHDAAHGFAKRRSVATNARPHVGKKIIVKADLADFFPSITYARVRGMLIALGYGYPVAATLAVLMTEADRQPVVIDGVTYHAPIGPRVTVQGAPTSPGLANAIVHRLDRRLSGLAKKRGFVYTRYADDLTFSSDDGGASPKRLLGAIRRLVEAEGFVLNAKKSRVLRPGRRMKVTGVTVNQVMGLSRTERRKIRAMAHQLAKVEGPDPRRAKLEGKLAYLSMLNPEQAARLRRP